MVETTQQDVLDGKMRLGSQARVVSSSIDFIISVSVELKEKRNYGADYPPQKAPLGNTAHKHHRCHQNKRILRIASLHAFEIPTLSNDFPFFKTCRTVSKSDLSSSVALTL